VEARRISHDHPHLVEALLTGLILTTGLRLLPDLGRLRARALGWEAEDLARARPCQARTRSRGSHYRAGRIACNGRCVLQLALARGSCATRRGRCWTGWMLWMPPMTRRRRMTATSGTPCAWPTWLLRPADPDDDEPDIACSWSAMRIGWDWLALIEDLHRAGSETWQWAIQRCRPEAVRTVYGVSLRDLLTVRDAGAADDTVGAPGGAASPGLRPPCLARYVRSWGVCKRTWQQRRKDLDARFHRSSPDRPMHGAGAILLNEHKGSALRGALYHALRDGFCTCRGRLRAVRPAPAECVPVCTLVSTLGPDNRLGRDAARLHRAAAPGREQDSLPPGEELAFGLTLYAGHAALSLPGHGSPWPGGAGLGMRLEQNRWRRGGCASKRCGLTIQ